MFFAKKWCILWTVLSLSTVTLPAASTAAWAASESAAVKSVPVSKSSLLYIGKDEAYLNGNPLKLEAPVLEVKGQAYLPAVSLPSLLGVSVQWQELSQSVHLTTPSAFAEFQLASKQLKVNGSSASFDKAATLINDRLYISMAWLEQYISFKATKNEELKRIDLLYVQMPADGAFHNDTMPNTKPIAQFSVNKDKYRLGEPIIYSDTSYDPDGDAITSVNWTGKAEAIFEPGLFKVSLQVTDSKGTESETFSRNVEIVNEPYLDPFEYKVYHEPVGTFVKDEEATLRKYLRDIPSLPNEAKLSKERPLIVSDSPETFTEKGFLYQEKVNGKARLYADHVNGMNEKVQFAIVVRNPNPDKTVKITTTRSGEVYPSIYANLIGNEASIEFLQDEGNKPETITVGPYQTVYYKKMPEFFPGQGMNVIYDVETDGEVYFSFVAMDAGADLSSIGMFERLDYTGNVRGTFSGSDVTWNVDAKSFTKPSSLAIGDGTSDPFVTGDDFFRKHDSLNLGNYGVVYKIHIENPRKMSVLLLPRGGVFKGPFEVNGRIIQTPPSGVMMDYQGYTILARTDGTEPSLDIEFTPAAGSAFPVDVIFYPLDDK
ncbi:copper amine oxidase N-terminal domain-containing protein [Paenibacillus sp. RC67]|uniref:copper amine oxidase N-terminal domain-containing protein n=1 Tax=Paenibacillus sp. RC67 TaxID=3039392 RepID=UPI0024AE1F54|nr:copper amine oxidase N-terminal domain-containing protein [Paenibacillus sp. RC67]